MPSIFHRIGAGFIRFLGWITLALLIAAWLGLPRPVFDWLNSDGLTGPRPDPGAIVMMGGGGIPSESGLTRAWQTAEEARRYPAARVIVAMPFEPGESETNRSAIQRELILRGVPDHRIGQEGAGRHTREQAERVRVLLGAGAARVPVLVVTSPEHLRRSVLAFRKAGFETVTGQGVENQKLEAELEYQEKPGTAISLGNWVGGSLMLRYQFWENLGMEIKVLRELAALAYYRARGWI